MRRVRCEEREVMGLVAKAEEALRRGSTAAASLVRTAMAPARSGDEKSEGGRAGDNKRGRGASE